MPIFANQAQGPVFVKNKIEAKQSSQSCQADPR